MNTHSPVSGIRWEEAFYAFLRTELTPSAPRWRNALRLTLLCALGTTFIIAFHIPYGEFLIIFFFAVSQPDAWASLRKARLRGIGTLVGGGIAIFGIVAWSDKPVLTLVAQALIFATGMFLFRTVTIPYAVLLATFTYVIATPVAATDPDGSVDKVLWRIALTTAGAVIGTLAQLIFWPDHPEKLLLEQLATRLETVESIIDHLANGDVTAVKSSALSVDTSAAATMAGQLDLLASAESGSRWLRQRHTEQIKLITDIEMVHIIALRLERLASENPSVMQLDSTRVRLQEIQRQLARIRLALIERSLPTSLTARSPTTDESIPALSAIAELEHILSQMPSSLAFLASTQAGWKWGADMMTPIRVPIAERTIFTPACRLSNIEVVRFALKVTLAATICYVIYQALNWPGISTSVVTCLLCAQSSVGAGFKKSLLRLAGAVIGGLTAVITVIVLLPNLDGAASFIVVTSALFFVASWLTVGSNRVSYIGLQMGLVYALVLVNQPNQSVDLSAAGDRILGVLLGITVMGYIDLTLWPNYASTALRRKLDETVRTLAMIPRHVARQAWNEAGNTALALHGQIAGTLALYNEGSLEFGSREIGSQADRARSLVIISGLEEVFLALLVMVRHRQAMDFDALPPAWQQRLQALDEAIAQHIESLASQPDKTTALDQGPQLSKLVGELQPVSDLWEPNETARRQLLEHAPIFSELVEALQRLERQTVTFYPPK